MIFKTVIHDCLWLNWALAEESLPPPPPPLRYDVFRTDQGGFIFASALLFRQHGLGARANLPGVSHPECQFHLCALDADGQECAWVFRMLLPNWLASSVRWVAGRPARGARLDYPPPGEPGRSGEAWTWLVRRTDELAVEARLASPAPGTGPSFGGFQKTLAYFRRQRSEFVMVRGRWVRVQVERERADAMPVAVSVLESSLVTEHLPGGQSELPDLHSAWLLPMVETSFVYASDDERSAVPDAPAPL